ncbi:hypothetical protein GTU73_15070 [Rathayibacter sp. VKM Ac-2804]|uniref:type II secretion system F family protein n=1 Tax=Rathayibacter sp. VKM Ac-2804 TaxID=2609257 RepID=UPI00132E86F4|nr:type II secretion system F family protein [Rathayibacter sp. VKM Ac-2804]QHF25192.1 hypothetical protein GTU73_15070 [Rathayibacter sp. VKM Ac-2804]
MRAIRRGKGVARRPRDHGEETAWAALAACWRVAADSGAPIAAALAELAESMRELGRARRDIEVALAGPLATSRVVGVLPLVALGFGTLLGFDVLGVLLGTVAGLVCLGGGLGLMLAAAAWTRRLVRGAGPGDPAPDWRSTCSRWRSRAADRSAAGGSGCWRRSTSAGSRRDRRRWRPRSRCSRCRPRRGVPAGRLLRSEAALARVRAASEARERAAKLGVTLLLPLGVCVLPAFLLLGVAPMMISVLLSTFAEQG